MWWRQVGTKGLTLGQCHRCGQVLCGQDPPLPVRHFKPAHPTTWVQGSKDLTEDWNPQEQFKMQFKIPGLTQTCSIRTTGRGQGLCILNTLARFFPALLCLGLHPASGTQSGTLSASPSSPLGGSGDPTQVLKQSLSSGHPLENVYWVPAQSRGPGEGDMCSRTHEESGVPRAFEITPLVAIKTRV